MILDINGDSVDVGDYVVYCTGGGMLMTGTISRITKTRVSVRQDEKYHSLYSNSVSVIHKYGNNKAQVMKYRRPIEVDTFSSV